MVWFTWFSFPNMNDFQLSPLRRSFFLGWNNTQPVAGKSFVDHPSQPGGGGLTSPPCSHRLHQVIVTPLLRRLHGELRPGPGRKQWKKRVWKAWRWGCNHLGTGFFVPYTIKREVGYFLGKYPRYIPTYATYIYIYMGGLYIIMVVWEMWGNILGTTASVPLLRVPKNFLWSLLNDMWHM